MNLSLLYSHGSVPEYWTVLFCLGLTAPVLLWCQVRQAWLESLDNADE